MNDSTQTFSIPSNSFLSQQTKGTHIFLTGIDFACYVSALMIFQWLDEETSDGLKQRQINNCYYGFFI